MIASSNFERREMFFTDAVADFGRELVNSQKYAEHKYFCVLVMNLNEGCSNFAGYFTGHKIVAFDGSFIFGFENE